MWSAVDYFATSVDRCHRWRILALGRIVLHWYGDAMDTPPNQPTNVDALDEIALLLVEVAEGSE